MTIKEVIDVVIDDLKKRTDNDIQYIDVIGKVLQNDENLLAYYDFLKKNPNVKKWELLYQAMEIKHKADFVEDRFYELNPDLRKDHEED